MWSTALASEDDHLGSLFLQRLPSADFRRLAHYMNIRTLSRDEVVWNGGDVITDILFPHDTTLAFICTMLDGTTVESATVGTEGFAGVESMLASATATGRVISGSGQASTIPLEQMLILTVQMPAVRAAMLTYAQSYLSVLFRLAACNAVHSLKQRICRRLLLSLCQTRQDHVAMTQDDLASALGIGRTSINQVCQELRNHNLISYGRGSIRIDDLPGLTRCACDCHVHLRRILQL